AVARNAAYGDEDAPAAVDVPNVTVLNLSTLVGDSERCPEIISNVVVYFDGDHMTATWSRALAPYLAELLAWPHGSKRPCAAHESRTPTTRSTRTSRSDENSPTPPATACPRWWRGAYTSALSE